MIEYKISNFILFISLCFTLQPRGPIPVPRKKEEESQEDSENEDDEEESDEDEIEKEKEGEKIEDLEGSQY